MTSPTLTDLLAEAKALLEKATQPPYRVGGMAMSKKDWLELWDKELVTIDGGE